MGVVIVQGTAPFDCFLKINNVLKLKCSTAFSNLESQKIYIHNYFLTVLSSCPTLPLRFGWNSAEILFLEDTDSDHHLGVESVRWTGVYVNREISSLENIQFTNPNPENTYDHSSNSNQLRLSETQPSDQVYDNSDSVKSTRRNSYDSNLLRKRHIVLSLWLLLTLIGVLSSTIWPLCFYHNFTPTITSK